MAYNVTLLIKSEHFFKTSSLHIFILRIKWAVSGLTFKPGTVITVVRKKIWSEKNFGLKKILVGKKNFGRKFFWSEQNFGRKKILVGKIFFGRNFFWWGGGVSGDPNFFLHISSSWVEIRLHAKNHLPRIFLLVGLK